MEKTQETDLAQLWEHRLRENVAPRTQSSEIGDLATALALAQANFRVADKDAENPFFHSKYADLQGVDGACRAALTKNGLSVSFTTELLERDPITVGDKLVSRDILLVHATLMHSSGQWRRSSLPIRPVKSDPQGTLSALKYARRGLLAAIVNVVDGDDDGNDASGHDEQAPAPAAKVDDQAVIEMSAITRLHRETGLPEDVLTWWLVDERALDVDEAGDPGPLLEKKLKWLLEDKVKRVTGPCTNWQTWMALINARKLARKNREPLRAYCRDRDQFEGVSIKRPDAWSNLKPSLVKQASEEWNSLYKAFKAWQENQKENGCTE